MIGAVVHYQLNHARCYVMSNAVDRNADAFQCARHTPTVDAVCRVYYNPTSQCSNDDTKKQKMSQPVQS
jgi:hypothetical protein